MVWAYRRLGLVTALASPPPWTCRSLGLVAALDLSPIAIAEIRPTVSTEEKPVVSAEDGLALSADQTRICSLPRDLHSLSAEVATPVSTITGGCLGRLQI